MYEYIFTGIYLLFEIFTSVKVQRVLIYSGESKRRLSISATSVAAARIRDRSDEKCITSMRWIRRDIPALYIDNALSRENDPDRNSAASRREAARVLPFRLKSRDTDIRERERVTHLLK